VESSCVIIMTGPVGDAWPAPLATWVLFRLTGPELLQKQLQYHQASTGLALGGVALSLLLTWNLGRTLKRQRREQERLRDELRRAEHLAGLGKLLAGVAHEVRNPLAAVRSTVQLWERLPDSTRTPASLGAVVGAVDRLNALVSRLLFFSRADHAEQKPVDLTQILAQTMDLLQAQAADQGVRLERELAANLPGVPGSPSALREVALNLLTNALQATPRGGCVRCTTGYLKKSREVEVRIRDTGTGVAPENRSHLFEPFFTTRPQGTGLGLALCREIVGNHGGRIEYEAGENGGSTFRFVLPIAGAESRED
jgi:signal transduction histidine kinase